MIRVAHQKVGIDRRAKAEQHKSADKVVADESGQKRAGADERILFWPLDSPVDFYRSKMTLILLIKI
jgi:hypothetical protein